MAHVSKHCELGLRDYQTKLIVRNAANETRNSIFIY